MSGRAAEGDAGLTMSDVATVPLLGSLTRHPERAADGRPGHAREAVIGDRALNVVFDARQLRAEVGESLRAVVHCPPAALRLSSHPRVAEAVAVMAGRDGLARAGSQIGAIGLVVAVDSGRVPIGAGDAVPGRHVSRIVDVQWICQEMLTNAAEAIRARVTPARRRAADGGRRRLHVYRDPQGDWTATCAEHNVTTACTDWPLAMEAAYGHAAWAHKPLAMEGK